MKNEESSKTENTVIAVLRIDMEKGSFAIMYM